MGSQRVGYYCVMEHTTAVNCRKILFQKNFKAAHKGQDLEYDGTVVKNVPDSAGDARNVGSIPGLGRSPRVGNGNPLQYFCLEYFMDR